MNLVPHFIRRRLAQRPNLVKIVGNMGWLFFDKVLRTVVGLFVGVWLARYLQPAQFGLLNFALAFTGLFGAIATLGLQGIVVRDIARDPESARLTLGTSAILQLMAGLVSFLLILTAVAYLRPEDALSRTIVAILGSAMLLKASEIAVYWFESQVQSKYAVWAQNAGFLVFAAVKACLILLEASLAAFAWAILFEATLVAALLLITLNIRGTSISKLQVSIARARTLLKDSWPLILSGLTITLYMKIDQIMLAQMIDDEAAGIYSAAVRISEAWYFIPMAVVASVFPAILEAKTRSSKEYYLRQQQLYDLMVRISIIVALPMTFLSGPLINLLFGPDYAEAGIILSIHIWASVFVFLGIASGTWFLAENLQGMSLQRTILGALVNIGLNLWLIPLFGGVGAAIATVISQAFAALFFDSIQKVTRPIFFMKLLAMNPMRINIKHKIHG